MMIERHITPELKFLAGEYPIVTVIGPRQSGKTTLVKQAFPNLPYVKSIIIFSRSTQNQY
jgi:predicted AAA+ superfamily ATPase